MTDYDDLDRTMRAELHAALAVEDGDAFVADAIIQASHFSPHVWARLDGDARQDISWALRSTYHAGYYDGRAEASE